jgi:DNA-binding XRE family transcriptional regulator
MDRRWSQETAAEEAKIARKTYIELENGKRTPKISTLDLLCSAFQASPQELGYNELGQLLVEMTATPPSQAVQQQPDDFLVLTREEVEWITHLLNLEEKVMASFDPSKRKTIQRLITAAGTTVVAPQLFINAEPWERLATGKPTDIDAAALDHFQELIRSCWGLSNSGQLDIAEQVLSGFLPRLIHMAPHDTEAAGLASEGLQLQSILVAHRLKISDKVTLCQRAVEIAEQSKNHNRLVACLIQLAVAYRYAQRPDEALKTLLDALRYCGTISPLLQSRVYVETSEALSRFGRKRESEFYLNLGYETFPAHPEQDPSFLFADCGSFTLAFYDGLSLLNMGQSSQAWDAFDRYLINLGNTVPERIRLEMVNHQGHAAILSGDLDKYVSCLEEGIAGAIALNSKKRFEEAYTTFQQDMPAAWLRETPIKQIVEQYGLTRLNT